MKIDDSMGDSKSGNPQLRVLLAGGGTAGHLNPAFAIAEIIKNAYDNVDFMFIGTPNGMEVKLLAKTDYKYSTMKVKGFQMKVSLKNIKKNAEAMFCLGTAGAASSKIISSFKPHIVIGTGGYVSGPITWMAARKKIPTVIFEPDAFPGITTKLLSNTVDHVMITSELALKHLKEGVKYTVTGLPLRATMRKRSREYAKKELGFDNSLCILSYGGSLGAGGVNDKCSDLIAWHNNDNSGVRINHIHGYGGNGKETFIRCLIENGVRVSDNPRLIVNEYIENMSLCMAAADLIICRAGANTLSELEIMGRASILIPSPVVSWNHQYYNAMKLGNVGAAIVIEEKDLTSDLLIKTVNDLYNHPEKLIEMGETASAQAITDTPERIMNVLKEYLADKFSF